MAEARLNLLESPPNRADYQAALERLRQRAHTRRATMFRGLHTDSLPIGFEGEGQKDLHSGRLNEG